MLKEFITNRIEKLLPEVVRCTPGMMRVMMSLPGMGNTGGLLTEQELELTRAIFGFSKTKTITVLELLVPLLMKGVLAQRFGLLLFS